MIAAFNRRQAVVWGLGPTPAAALADAHGELALKSERVRAAGLGRIEYATVTTAADPVTMDGAALFGCLSMGAPSAGLQLEIDL